jgi:hypothetical protein
MEWAITKASPLKRFGAFTLRRRNNPLQNGMSINVACPRHASTASSIDNCY